MRLAVALSVLGALGIAPPPASAHGPTPQKAEEKITIAAPPAAVWKAVQNFADLAAWHPGVERSTGGNEPGAEREVTLKSGGVIVDGLDEFNAGEMFYRYRLAKENVAAFPVSSYFAKLAVKPADGGGSEVEWMGRFYRGDTSNFPPENLNDEAAKAAMDKFFREGLDGLKAKLEASR